MIQPWRALAATSVLAFLFVQCGGSSPPPDAPPTPSMDNPPPAEPPSSIDGGVATLPATPATVASAAAESTPAPAASAATDAAKTKLTDAQIAKITLGANSAEIEQANLALQRSKDAEIQKFAKMMVKHHGEAKKDQEKLKIDPADSPLAAQLGGDANSTLSSLEKASASDFDRMYIAAQVNGHRKVLSTLQDRLLKDVSNEQLKAYLEKIQPTVEKHLKKAEEIQLAREKKATANSDSKSTLTSASNPASAGK